MVNTKKIKAKIQEMGMTQGDISEKIGISRAYFCQKINNIRPMSLSEAEKIAEILKISDEDFTVFFCVGVA